MTPYVPITARDNATAANKPSSTALNLACVVATAVRDDIS
jgi:hypothetical protein